MKSYKKDYPRPQFFRSEYMLLDGTWEFSFDDTDVGEKNDWFQGFEKQYDILVPFTYETKKSGIGDESVHNHIWYKKSVTIPQEWKKEEVILHFEGSDYITKVWVNGIYIGDHRGGYSRFSFSISKALKSGENEIVVKVEDSLDTRIARGKQRWIPENFGCWYVQTTGIWKSVWLEHVSEKRISNIKMTPNIEDSSIEIEGEVISSWDDPLWVEMNITFQDLPVAKVQVPVMAKTFQSKVKLTSFLDTPLGVHYWSPKNPELYDIQLTLKSEHEVLDQVLSYFGMREIRIKGNQILLNGRPLYQRLILDQGYWEESHLTPPSEDALIEDIDKIMELGYNGLRKHQKTEDERFLYWCDVKGMLVWSEMAAAYTYSDYAVDHFTKEWIDIVRQNYNHPSIITWTPINESWGVPRVETNYKQQQFTEAIYHLTKSFDSMRPVIVNDGWEHTVSDIITLHDYEATAAPFLERYLQKDKILSNEIYHNKDKGAFANGYEYKGQPIIISEYGGIALDNDDNGWGYGDKVNNAEELIARFENITDAIKELPYCCGYCYTQVTDVQQEINGLMDIKRKFKVDPVKIKEINLKNIKQSSTF